MACCTDVQHYEGSGIEVARQIVHQLTECFYATRRRPDHDDVPTDHIFLPQRPSDLSHRFWVKRRASAAYALMRLTGRGVGLEPVLQHRLPTLFRAVCKGEQRDIFGRGHALLEERVEIDDAMPVVVAE